MYFRKNAKLNKKTSYKNKNNIMYKKNIIT